MERVSNFTSSACTWVRAHSTNLKITAVALTALGFMILGGLAIIASHSPTPHWLFPFKSFPLPISYGVTTASAAALFATLFWSALQHLPPSKTRRVIKNFDFPREYETAFNEAIEQLSLDKDETYATRHLTIYGVTDQKLVVEEVDGKPDLELFKLQIVYLLDKESSFLSYKLGEMRSDAALLDLLQVRLRVYTLARAPSPTSSLSTSESLPAFTLWKLLQLRGEEFKNEVFQGHFCLKFASHLQIEQLLESCNPESLSLKERQLIKAVLPTGTEQERLFTNQRLEMLSQDLRTRFASCLPS